MFEIMAGIERVLVIHTKQQ